jgi:thiamine-phosphate pyrophosphorylase
VNPVDLRLYGILDTGRLGTDSIRLADLARAAVRGGCTLLQLRDKTADTRAMVARARVLATAGFGVPVLVNDRVDVALAAGADGVHLGQEDMAPADARRLLGPRAIVGLTLKSSAHADALYREPVDYGCVGGVYATASKDNPDPPLGPAGLNRVVFRARLARGPAFPIGAIAGIDAGNAPATVAAGADGVAVIAALFLSEDVEAEARRLRAAVDGALAARGVA